PVGPHQAGEAQAANAQRLAARDAVTQARAPAEEGKHASDTLRDESHAERSGAAPPPYLLNPCGAGNGKTAARQGTVCLRTVPAAGCKRPLYCDRMRCPSISGESFSGAFTPNLGTRVR